MPVVSDMVLGSGSRQARGCYRDMWIPEPALAAGGEPAADNQLPAMGKVTPTPF